VSKTKGTEEEKERERKLAVDGIRLVRGCEQKRIYSHGKVYFFSSLIVYTDRQTDRQF